MVVTLLTILYGVWLVCCYTLNHTGLQTTVHGVLALNTQPHTLTETSTPGHCLSFLMRYQREGLSNDLTWQLISSIAHGNNYCHKSLPTPLLAAPSTFASQWQHSLAESTCSRLGVMIQKKREKFPWLRLNYVYAYMQWGRPSVQINTWKSSESCIAWFLLSSR